MTQALSPRPKLRADLVDWPYSAVLARGGLARPPVDRLTDCGADVLEHRRQRGELLQGPHREICAYGVDTLVEFKADEGGGDRQAEPGGGRGTEPSVGLRAGQHLGEDREVASRALVRMQRPAEIEQIAQ